MTFFINLIFVDEKTIQNLNKKYRKIDKPTTVLSFFYGLGEEKGFPKGAGFPAGEVFVCPTVVEKQKIKIEKVIIHGINNILSEIPATKACRIGLKRNKSRFT